MRTISRQAGYLHSDPSSIGMFFLKIVTLLCLLLVESVACYVFCLQTQANTRKWLVEQSLKVPEVQPLEVKV